MTHAQTLGDFGDSLTGFDEIAIAQRFGRTITEMTSDFSMFTRALIFVAKRRDGANDEEAWTGAMELAFLDVSTFFAEATPAEDEAEDAGDSGKDEEPELLPETSLSSVF